MNSPSAMPAAAADPSLPLATPGPQPPIALPDLERFYDALAEALDRAGPDKTPLLLTKLALLLAAEVGDPAVIERALGAAQRDL